MKSLLTLLLIPAFCFSALTGEAKAQALRTQNGISQSVEFQGGIANNTGDLRQVNPIVFGRYGVQLKASVNEDIAVFAELGVNGGHTQFRWSENQPLTQHFFLSPDLRLGLKWINSRFEPYVFLRTGALTNGGWESDSGIGTSVQIVDHFSLVGQLSIQSLALTGGIRTQF